MIMYHFALSKPIHCPCLITFVRLFSFLNKTEVPGALNSSLCHQHFINDCFINLYSDTPTYITPETIRLSDLSMEGKSKETTEVSVDGGSVHSTKNIQIGASGRRDGCCWPSS